MSLFIIVDLGIIIMFKIIVSLSIIIMTIVNLKSLYAYNCNNTCEKPLASVAEVESDVLEIQGGSIKTEILTFQDGVITKKGVAEKMGGIAGPYVFGGVVGASTSALPITGITSVFVGAGTGAIGVHAVGELGKDVGEAYGKYIDQTGSNPLLPSFLKKDLEHDGSNKGCGSKSFAECVYDTVEKVLIKQDN